MKKIFLILVPLIMPCFFIIISVPHETKPGDETIYLTIKAQKNKISEDQFEHQHEFSSDLSMEHVDRSLNCKSCHVSEYPTKKDPGLFNCPRGRMVSVYHSPQEGPQTVVIDEMSENYTGVVFSHRVHAEMSGMSSGCTGCHHYNTTGPVLNCRNCHEKTRKREDVSVPDLKAAYHRQCMTCHKKWSSEKRCNYLCHQNKGEVQKPFVDSLRGKSHPELPVPKKLTWETNSEKNKIVTFYHDEHVSVFKLSCTSCHKQESCINCHGPKKQDATNNPVKIEKSLEEHHKPCISCHYGNSCLKCHSDKELAPFDHGRSSGWTLSSYHSSISCAKCHGTSMPYRKLNTKCVSCHGGFAEAFDHKLKGFTFSEAHKELDCQNCHANRDFTKSPVCTDCHDDKSFPPDLPGKR